MLDKVAVIRTAFDLFEVVNLLGPLHLVESDVKVKLLNDVLVTSTACVTLNEQYGIELEVTVGNDNFDKNILSTLGISEWGPKELLDDFADPEILADLLNARSLSEALNDHTVTELQNMKIVFTYATNKSNGKIFRTPRNFIIALENPNKPKQPYLYDLFSKVKKLFLTKIVIA